MAEFVELSALAYYAGGVHAERGPVLTWGRDALGQRAIAIEQQPTDYELTNVPAWVRGAVEARTRG